MAYGMGKVVMKKLAILVSPVLLALVLLDGPSASREAVAAAATEDGPTAAAAVAERLHEVLLSCMREGGASIPSPMSPLRTPRSWSRQSSFSRGRRT